MNKSEPIVSDIIKLYIITERYILHWMNMKYEWIAFQIRAQGNLLLDDGWHISFAHDGLFNFGLRQVHIALVQVSYRYIFDEESLMSYYWVR